MGDWSTRMTSLRCWVPERLAIEVCGVRAFGLAEGLHEGAVEDLVDDGGLARAGDAGDAAEQAERDVEVDAARLWMRAPVELEVLAAGLAAVFGDGDGEAAGKIAAGDGVGIGGDFGDGARGEELAAELAGAGAEVEQVVGGADDVGVVLDDEDGVAEVAKLFHDADELGGVAGVEADGGLVEDVERADEARTERGGELNALRLAAGERGAEAVEGEVVEADLVEEVDALADFFEDLAGDLGLCGGERKVVEEVPEASVMVRAETSQMFFAGWPARRTARASARRRCRGSRGRWRSRGTWRGRRGRGACTSCGRARRRSRGCRGSCRPSSMKRCWRG